MQKIYFHNGKSTDKNLIIKRSFGAQPIGEKQIVDINKLLNRVKKDKKNETKRKIIFYSTVILALALFATFITLIK